MCDALQLNWKLNPTNSVSKSHQKKSKGRNEGKNSKAYTLRACSIQKRMETEHRKALPKKRGPKPRPKTAPMSKYRRKTANLRERQRMGEINSAFERLRDKIPNPVLSGRGKCEKLTKINILHVTINYIRAMENLLTTGDSGIRSFSEMVRNPIRPNEKPNKFEHLDFEDCDEDEEGFDLNSDQHAKEDDQKLGKSKNTNKNKKTYRKPAKKPKPIVNARRQQVAKPIVSSLSAQGDHNMIYSSSNEEYVLPSAVMIRPMQDSTSMNNIMMNTFKHPSISANTSGCSSLSSSPIKSCLETSSDSGISVTSSSSCSPTFSLDDISGSPCKMMDDPLLGSSFLNNQTSGNINNNNKHMLNQIINNNSGSSSGLFDAPVTDEMLKEVVSLFDTIQDSDLPDISFEDPFDFFPKTL